MNSALDDPKPIARDAILEQLGRIVVSKALAGSERSVGLLTFVVEHALKGAACPLKEYTLGIEVLGKPSSFDPRTDTIVRAEVSRLRSRLEKYYTTEGSADPVVIRVPKGTYEPRFQAGRDSPKNRSVAQNGWIHHRTGWLAGVIGFAACIVAIALLASWRAPPPEAPISLAVLPFTNLSGEESQEFFSDGITEEINAALTKVPDLHVVARTSAFQFKGQNGNVRAVGQALGATHLIEGSVRKAGNRVRITAQLVRADNGLNLWSENYDRELTDIFTIQEDIARAIAMSLRAPLGLKPGETLVAYRPKDEETYELYLRGVNALRLRNGETRPELELLEKVVARDPNYAPGWAKLAEARLEMVTFYDRRNDESKKTPLLDGAAGAAKKAMALAPGYAAGYGALAGVAARRGQWADAMDLVKEGLDRDPFDPELMGHYAGLLTTLGYLKDGLRARERQHLLEPLIPLYNRSRMQAMAANGMMEAGVREAERLNCECYFFRLPAYAELGRFAEVADTAEMMLKTLPPSILLNSIAARPLLEPFAQSFRSLANKTPPPAQLPAYYSEWNFVYAHVDVPERMLEWPEKTIKNSDYRLTGIWWPTPSSVRKTERFKTLARNAGLVDYWRERGWPDLCRPQGADDFVCN